MKRAEGEEDIEERERRERLLCLSPVDSMPPKDRGCERCIAGAWKNVLPLIKTWKRFVFDNENTGLIIHILYKRNHENMTFLFRQSEILEIFHLSLINTLLLSFQVEISQRKKETG